MIWAAQLVAEICKRVRPGFPFFRYHTTNRLGAASLSTARHTLIYRHTLYYWVTARYTLLYAIVCQYLIARTTTFSIRSGRRAAHSIVEFYHYSPKNSRAISPLIYRYSSIAIQQFRFRKSAKNQTIFRIFCDII